MALGIPGRDRGERHHRDSLPDLLQEEKMAVVIDTIKKLNAGALSSDCRQSPDRKVRAFLVRESAPSGPRWRRALLKPAASYRASFDRLSRLRELK